MLESGFETKKQEKLKLNPISKIIILVLLSFIVFSNAPLEVAFPLVVMPFLCLLTNNTKIAVIYITSYICAKLLMIYIIPNISGILNTLIIGFLSIIIRMLPTIVMGYYTISTTKVSEFMAAMDMIHMPKAISISLSVIFRYFPTVIQDFKSIINAMKMKGIWLNINALKSPVTLLEHIFIPMLINGLKTIDDLSAASLTRGLSNPKNRTYYYENKISPTDIIFITASFLGLIMLYFK